MKVRVNSAERMLSVCWLIVCDRNMFMCWHLAYSGYVCICVYKCTVYWNQCGITGVDLLHVACSASCVLNYCTSHTLIMTYSGVCVCGCVCVCVACIERQAGNQRNSKTFLKFQWEFLWSKPEERWGKTKPKSTRKERRTGGGERRGNKERE